MWLLTLTDAFPLSVASDWLPVRVVRRHRNTVLGVTGICNRMIVIPVAVLYDNWTSVYNIVSNAHFIMRVFKIHFTHFVIIAYDIPSNPTIRYDMLGFNARYKPAEASLAYSNTQQAVPLMSVCECSDLRSCCLKPI